ncbi:TetR/AcrR family transcriptional regulator [Acinetobacter wuhouensis]|uniref:TetR/AcrR family transcriptional regulator n=1 Tax=Acinetobacter wuhouensis TaxID=1879050 RepID=A0A385C7V9_9GAMM|nr:MULTISPECIES: TetR/AcrR family transcriptional regulator [Acinetobacter]AXQ23820.1 TetR/AcrR family transcriptional regulator [Acinetobacter wuhouensis]RZG45393.1 TetR/AcrR family transcriptional regulator [Acinetobacter wuhouensis]RZG84563.1 TetR/AcrR family transcriptional regulator [Acinetobacter sp. WCHAc060033]
MANSEEHIQVSEKQDIHPELKRRRGRPKCFDEQEALQKAMMLFWKYGYEATAMSDLTKALNLTAPSIYSTFGDKSQLFHACLDYYLKHEACSLDLIFQQAETAKVAIEIYLYENLKKLLQQDKPTGCMLVTATMNCSEQHQPLQHDLLLKRQQVKEKIYQRLQQGVEDGDLSSDADIQAMTDYYSTVIQGLTMQARDGVAIEQLENVVTLALKTWTLF